jgi:hypothetical protein
MKGIHWTIILAIIIFAVLLVIMFTVFISPIQGQGSVFFNEAEFRRYCAWWATTDYKDTFAVYKDENGIERQQDMTGLCTQALKLPPGATMDQSNWDKCKSMCRVAY